MCIRDRVTGVATIGTQNSTSGALNVGGISTFSGDIFVGSGATLQANGNAAFAGIGTFGGDLNVGGNLNAGDITIDEITARNINITGFATFSAIGGNLIPDADNTHSIGAATSEWKDLFIDGTANIDTLAADTAAIGDLTDNRVVIAGSGGELEDSGNLTFDGTTLAVTGQETVSVDVTVGTGVTLQRHGGVSIAGITTIGGTMSVSPSGNERLSVKSDTVEISVEDNTTSAFFIKQASNEYITVDTNNASELLTLGNTTTNPDTLILGSKTTVGLSLIHI